MSLIGDALRKARQEAADRESERKGILFSAKIADGPTRSNLGLGLALGALIAVIATVAGGTAVWWILGVGDADRDQSRSAPSAALVDPASGSESAFESASESSGQRQQAAAASGTAAAAETATGADPAPAPAPESASASASDPDAVPMPVPDDGEQGQRPAAVTAPASAPESHPMTESGFVGKEGDEEIYILEADLGNGVSLSLDFLIFREEDPFAEINGVELHLGGTIGGYRVKAIERDRVTLSNGRRTVVLRAP